MEYPTTWCETLCPASVRSWSLVSRALSLIALEKFAKNRHFPTLPQVFELFRCVQLEGATAATILRSAQYFAMRYVHLITFYVYVLAC